MMIEANISSALSECAERGEAAGEAREIPTLFKYAAAAPAVGEVLALNIKGSSRKMPRACRAFLGEFPPRFALCDAE